jgi:hypothetical protein
MTSTRVLPAEIEARVRRDRPAIVAIAVLPPGGVPQARYLCRRLRKEFPDLPIIVGFWGKVRNFDQFLVKFRKAGASYVTTSMVQSRNQIQALLSLSNTAAITDEAAGHITTAGTAETTQTWDPR